MNLDQFNRQDFEKLMDYVAPRNIGIQEDGPGIIMRHDIDDNLERAVKMAEVESEHGVRATYFMLNTASYWNTKWSWEKFRYIESMGHEIAWHNNVITEWIKAERQQSIDTLIIKVLCEFLEEGFTIKGSASHGDGLCYVHNYVNNQVFTAFPKVGLNGKPNTLDYQQVKMEDYGLEYEAYAIPRDVYLSESGKKWRSEINESDLRNQNNRVCILIHPQHWQL